MIRPTYYKAQRFFPDKEFEVFSKILGKAEIVSYDAGLNLSVTIPFINEVDSLDLLLQTSLKPDEQIIAYYKNPLENHVSYLSEAGFEFCGYDLSEEQTGFSAITNCGGGFEDAIPYSKLNKYGLIQDYDEAFRIGDLLYELYGDDPHANCEIYELWRLVSK